MKIRLVQCLFTLIAAVVLIPRIHGAEFVAEADGFAWTRGGDIVRVSTTGKLQARVEGGAELSWDIAFWHDLAGGYERQEWASKNKGRATANVVTLEGKFVRKSQVLPLEYVQTVTAKENEVHVRYDVKKTGAIRLRRGVQLAVTLPFDSLAGKRLFLRPGRAAKIPSFVRAVGDAFAVELMDSRAVEVELSGFRAMRISAAGKDAALLYVSLLDDMAVGETLAAEVTIRFRELPQILPGEIVPSNEALALRGAAPNKRRVPLYDKFELEVDLSASYENPFDPDQVALDAHFTTPSGKDISVPGFYMVEFKRSVIEAGEVLEPTGKRSWGVRFTPTEVGHYKYKLTLRDRSGAVEGGRGAFEAVPSKLKGFVRTSKADPHYFSFDNGDSYFPIGHNLPSYHITGQIAEQALRKMAEAGENYNRWWMSSYTGLGLEWEHELGWYRQDEAWRLDEAFKLGRELGMCYMLCMDTHQDFRYGRSWDNWRLNPYNANLGGPCQTPGDWFTNPIARDFYKKRLRYIVARWSYSPNLLALELGNEFEGWPDATNEEKLAWHKEMAGHIKAIDPFRHLVTTSFWSTTGPPEFWNLKAIDIVQTHCYTNDDGGVARKFARFCATQADSYAKPHIFGEFGIRSQDSTHDKDAKGWHLHNALWSCLASRCAGAPMPWWHESYIDPQNLYFHFTSIARFVADIPFASARLSLNEVKEWRPLEADPVELAPGEVKQTINDAELTPQFHWGKPPVDLFTVKHDATVNDLDKLPRLLQGQGHKDLRNAPTFVVDYEQNGRFIVHVDKVSRSGLLRIWLDDELELQQELPCGENLGKKSVWREQWNLWETVYDETFGIDVPKGKHRIRVDNNEGGDWIWIKRYVLTDYQTITRPPLLVLGMQNDTMALLWAHNLGSTWLAHAKGEVADPIKPARITIRGLRDGPRTIEWWETWKGSIIRKEAATVKENKLSLKLPPIATDVAVKIR